MYRIEATITEDLAGFQVAVECSRHSGRKVQILSSQLWLIGCPEDARDDAHRRIQSRIVGKTEELSEFLRRVASGVSRLDGES